MSKSRIAPVRPSIAKILKRQIGGFVREYEREVNRPAEPAEPPSRRRHQRSARQPDEHAESAAAQRNPE